MISLSETLTKLLSSEIKADLLVLFHKNPGLIDGLDGVARRIGRVADSIKADIDELVDIGILKKKRVGKSEVLVLDRTRDRVIQNDITVYLKSLKEKRGH